MSRSAHHMMATLSAGSGGSSTSLGFDSATDGGLNTSTPSSIAWSHTCSGTNRVLWVVGFAGNGGSPDITGASYAGDAMTPVAHVQEPSGWWLSLFALVGPALGANAVVLSQDGGSYALAGASASYNGAKQSGQPDGSNTGTATASSLAVSATTAQSGDWMVSFWKSDAGTISAGTATTLRLNSASGLAIGDSNGSVGAAGSYALQAQSTSSSCNWAGIVGGLAHA